MLWEVDDSDDCFYWLDFNHYKEILDDGMEVHVIECMKDPIAQ